MSGTDLTDLQRVLLNRVVNGLAQVPGVAAVVLGGSHARGRARVESDLDLGLLYRGARPIDIGALQVLAGQLNDTPDPVVSPLSAWGRFVDGGAWLTIRGQRVDFLYRDVGLVEAVLADAQAGRFELDWAQQPPFGFFGPTILGEVAIARPLHDPHGVVAELQRAVSPMPDALIAAVVQANLWQVDFGLRAFAPKFAAKGDAYGLAGCLGRFANALVHALFALNRAWFLNDKTALEEVAGFAVAPAQFSPRVAAMLGVVGTTVEAQQTSLAACAALFRETAVLAGDLYRPAWDF
jgi:predicted nucleotidyltransferase